ncbi:MAG: peptide/nickel transport system permease protein [Candidatus Sumerlaeota bacterium]|nr:peptide/nickel transport system permease protein [Candidatus Sumerlaeota bacterium]
MKTTDEQASAPSPSYWQLTLRDMRRNRMGMFGLAIVLIVTTIGVFAPLIANGRPLHIRMVFEDEYDQAYFIVLDAARQTQQLMERASDKSPDEILPVLDRALGLMKASLPNDKRERLAVLGSELRAPLLGRESFDTFGKALAAFEQEFDLPNVTLQPSTRYPAVRALQRPEIFFMLFYLLTIPALVFRRVFRSWFQGLLAIVVLAAIGTFLWTLAFPLIQDTFPYRTYFESPEFHAAGNSVLLCPIPYGENENLTAENRQPPTFLLDPERRAPNQHFHLMGTDTNGRDVAARMVYGARISMMIGIVAVSIYVTIGMILGALAGFYGGWIDLALSRLIEIVICFPVLFLILAVQAFATHPSILNIMVLLGLVSWTGVARLQRGEFIRLVNRDFVMAVRGLGGSNMRIIFHHVLPNALGPILVTISFGIAGSIVVESALSYLGFGVPQPMASWGDLLNNGRNDIQGTWWLTVFPGMAIFLTVTCFNLVGEAVRDALDPRREH